MSNSRVDSDSNHYPTPNPLNVASSNATASNVTPSNVPPLNTSSMNAPPINTNTYGNHNQLPFATTAHSHTMTGSSYTPGTSFATNIQPNVGYPYQNASTSYSHAAVLPNNTWDRQYEP